MNMADKRIFFISNSIVPKKDAGGGSVIIYRHLIRLKEEGCKVTIVIFGLGTDYYDNFDHVFIPKKLWYPFLRKKTPLLTDILINLYYSALATKIKFNPATDIILGVLCEISNLVLVKIFKKKYVPFFLFFHDDNIFNRYWADIALTEGHIDKILTEAKYIFSVSRPMATLLETRGGQNTSVLYPIPEVYKGAIKRYKTVDNETLNFCYAGLAMRFQFDIMTRISEAISNIDGKFYCITGELEGFKPCDPETIIVKDKFDTVAELQQFIIQNVDVVVVFYSFDLQHEPRMESSFPSKFLEYAQLGLPILLVAPDYSSLGKWAIENNWLSYVATDDMVILIKTLEKFKDSGYWLACQEQVVRIANNQFNPENIHQQLIQYLNIEIND